MNLHCLTELEVRRRIKENRNGDFPLILLVVMIWWSICAVAYPVETVVRAAAKGAEHPLAALWWEQLLLFAVAGGLSFLLFRWWRRLRRGNSPKLFTLTLGRCEDKKYHDLEDHSWYSVTAKGWNGAFGDVTVSDDTYKSIQKGDQLYVLVNGNQEIKAIWKYENTYLARDVLPLLSHADQMLENRKREELEPERERAASQMQTEEQTAAVPERAAHFQGRLTEENKRGLRMGFLVRALIFVLFFLLSFFLRSISTKSLLAFCLLIVIGIVYDSSQDADCAFVGRAFAQEKEKAGGDRKELEKRVRRRLKTRRLKLAAANLLWVLPCLVCAIIGKAADMDDFMTGWIFVAFAFVLLSLRRAVEALVRKPRNWEEDLLSVLLGK